MTGIHPFPGRGVRSRRFRGIHALPLAILIAGIPWACSKQGGERAREVVVYVALDRAFSEPIFEAFTRKTGIAVKPQYDTESTKTVGLSSRIRAEASRPRCDVFWNNEILNTIRLESEGLLQPFNAAGAEGFPEDSRDREKTWYGFAARARVLIVNTRLVPRESLPGSIRDLARPEWKGRTAIAKPLFGTTASHVACLFAALGADRATEYLDSLKKNSVRVEGGNKGCAMAVAAGTAAFALTDTDDAIAEVESGKPVTVIYPDADADGLGTLFLPNTVAILKGAPHPTEARELVNFLLTPEVEEMLAAGPSAQIPLHEGAKPCDRVRGPGQVKPMRVDFEAAASCFEEARKVVEERFLK